MAALGCIAVFAVCADFCGLAAVGLLVGWTILPCWRRVLFTKLAAGAVGLPRLRLAAMADPAGFTWGAYLGAAAPSTWTHCPATRLFSVGAAVVRARAIG